MMNENFLRILNKLSSTKTDIESLWEQGEVKTFEDRQAYCIIENIIESMDTAVYTLKRYIIPAIEGKLQEENNGKFGIVKKDGKGLGWYFSCGDYIEVMGDDGKWYPGRVEHTTRNGSTGYYFHNSDMEYPFLYTGMKARVRKKIEE